MVFNTAGSLLREFGTLGSGPGQFNRPAGIVMDHINNVLYVADSVNQRIQKLDLNGNFIMQFGSAGSGQGELGLISQSDIDLDDYGYLYVVDTNNHRVQIFDLDGNYAGQIGAKGGARENDSLRFPYSVSVEGNRLVVADTYNFQIEVYDLVVQADADGDNVADVNDNCPNTSNADQLDTDLDGLGDVCDSDDDDDGTLDVDDAFPLDDTESVDTDGDGIGNNADTDDDNDGLLDLDEVSLGTNILLADTDSDGLGDSFEVIYGFDPLVAGEEVLDGDNDGLNNLTEQAIGTDPTLTDTDSDGLNDGDEVNIHGTDPNNPDTDGDSVSDGDEVTNGTDPTVADGSYGDLAPYGAPNGLLDVGDFVVLQEMLLGRIAPTADEIIRGDLNGNGLLDLGDLVLLNAVIQ
ncbi:MAG: NHL repeat-containing protein, partial [Gammaproteobacteria bacterium]|nr:NHL repeat-containing protein [Gammaproteobacteria bacterium]